MAKEREHNCKVCKSNIRLDLEIKRIVQGMSLRDVENYAEECGFNVNHVTLQKHFNEHVDEKRQVQVRYLAEKQSENSQDMDEVTVKLKELKNLDSALAEATLLMKAASHEIQRQLAIKIPCQRKLKDDEGNPTGQIMTYDKVEVSHSVVTLFKGATEEIRQTAKAKMDILGIDKKKVAEKDAIDTLVDAIQRLDEE